MKTNYSTLIYSKTKNLPLAWDSIAGHDLFLTKDYLHVLQDSAPKNMTCAFVGFFENETLIGVALSQMVCITDLKSFGVNKSCLKASIRDFVFKYAANHVLFIGNNMLTGQHAFKFLKDVSPQEKIVLLHKGITDLKKYFADLNQKIHLTIIKDFDNEEVELLKSGFSDFYNFEIQPNMVFDINMKWQTADDYFTDLSKKYRDQMKRARKKMNGIEKRKMSLQDIVFHQTRIYELYINVTKNAPFNTFYLSENHFESMKKHLGSHFHFYGYFENNDLIGFDTLIKNGESMETYFLGYDDLIQRDRMLYLNMLYDMIGFSINKKFKQIVFARTALEIKSSVGAKPVRMYGFIQHRNKLLNSILPKVFKYFEPKVDWKERNPFKEIQ